MKERLELVTSFNSLNAGMIVVVKCSGCGGMHRGLLLSRGAGFCGKSETFPMLPPMGSCGLLAEVCECAVTHRRTYRVIDGLESSSYQTIRTRRPKTEAAR